MNGRDFEYFERYSQNNVERFQAQVELDPEEFVVFVTYDGEDGILSSVTSSTAKVELEVLLKPLEE